MKKSPTDQNFSPAIQTPTNSRVEAPILFDCKIIWFKAWTLLIRNLGSVFSARILINWGTASLAETPILNKASRERSFTSIVSASFFIVSSKISTDFESQAVTVLKADSFIISSWWTKFLILFLILSSSQNSALAGSTNASTNKLLNIR